MSRIPHNSQPRSLRQALIGPWQSPQEWLDAAILPLYGHCLAAKYLTQAFVRRIDGLDPAEPVEMRLPVECLLWRAQAELLGYGEVRAEILEPLTECIRSGAREFNAIVECDGYRRAVFSVQAPGGYGSLVPLSQHESAPKA